MALVGCNTKKFEREIDKWSKEFYEFVSPAIDMYEKENNLIVEIDLPGFGKADIHLRIIDGNILSISAKKKLEERTGEVYCAHRPTQINKRIILPISTKEGEKVTGTAKYSDGVVALTIPIPQISVVPIT
jgi:HSP20 family molecular chaperone IbpA